MDMINEAEEYFKFHFGHPVSAAVASSLASRIVDHGVRPQAYDQSCQLKIRPTGDQNISRYALNCIQAEFRTRAAAPFVPVPLIVHTNTHARTPNHSNWDVPGLADFCVAFPRRASRGSLL